MTIETLQKQNYFFIGFLISFFFVIGLSILSICYGGPPDISVTPNSPGPIDDGPKWTEILVSLAAAVGVIVTIIVAIRIKKINDDV